LCIVQVRGRSKWTVSSSTYGLLFHLARYGTAIYERVAVLPDARKVDPNATDDLSFASLVSPPTVP
jgi:hypothetical protein